MSLEEKVEWLEGREKKLEELELMIYKMQDNINTEEVINKIDDIKMEIFKAWYFVHFEQHYNDY